MHIKTSEKVLVKVASLSIKDCNYDMHRKVWKAFDLGRDYARLLGIEIALRSKEDADNSN